MSQDLRHSFPSQEKDEAVFVFARPYWVAFLPTAGIFLVVFLFSVLAQVLISSLPIGLTVASANAIILAIGVFQLFTLIVFLVSILDFYFDIIVVTDRRLADINQKQLFSRRISELNLRDVEDTSFQREGFFQTILDFGLVEVQTAGEKSNFVIHNLRYPSQIAGIISDLADQAKAERPDSRRFPELDVLGVIDQKLITDPADLVILEAMLPDDIRRTYKRHVS